MREQEMCAQHQAKGGREAGSKARAALYLEGLCRSVEACRAAFSQQRGVPAEQSLALPPKPPPGTKGRSGRSRIQPGLGSQADQERVRRGTNTRIPPSLQR